MNPRRPLVKRCWRCAYENRLVIPVDVALELNAVLEHETLNADPITARASQLRWNIFSIGNTFAGARAPSSDGLVHTKIHVYFGGAGYIRNRKAAS